MSVSCPKCGSRYLRPSRSHSVADGFAVFRLQSPYRCLDCNERFFAPILPWRDLFFSSCPRCHRMDLNGWTGKTYTPPFWTGLKVSLGAHKWRCEYCRFNFASFRDRKEVFTFKRWRKWGHQAEDHQRESAVEKPEQKDKASEANA